MEENTEKSKRNANKSWYILMLVVGIIILIGFIFWLLMKGDVKTTGEYPDDVTPGTLKCVAKNLPYKFFKDNPSNTEIEVNAIFAKSRVDSVSFIIKAFYDDSATAKTMSDGHQGDMNNSFYSDGMEAFSLEATFSLNDKMAQMSLYAKPKDLNDVSSKYLMVGSLPENLTGYKRAYLAQGFTCEVKR